MKSPGAERHLEWEGAFNVRDLGGLPVAGGRIRRGALVRGDTPERLTEAGWAALWEHGVRTVVDLRNADELAPDLAPRPEGLRTVQIPLDVAEDREFWRIWESGPQFGTPLYYGPHIERFPERSGAVLAAVAEAQPGGVFVHCVGGRDRTGQISMLALLLAGASPETAADDYALSADRLRSRYEALGEPDQGPEIDAYLAERRLTPREALRRVATEFDRAAFLRAAGLGEADLERLRVRLAGSG